MPPAPVTTADSQLSGLDETATIELCKSLADYGEAGGLSRDLMLRVGSYATASFPKNLDVLLAAARMYRMGGELDHAKTTLLGAGKLAPTEARTVGLLKEVLHELGERGDAGALLHRAHDEAGGAPPSSRSRAALRSPPAARDHGRAQRTSDAPTREIALDVMQSAAEHPEATGPRPVMPKVPPNSVTMPTMRAVRARGDLPSPVPPPREPPAPRSPLPSPREAALPPHRPERAASAGDPPRARVNKLRLLSPDDPNRLLDPYELVGEIASGGMATVYLGRLAGPSGFQRLVAIKRLHPHLAREEQFVEMFLDEARLAAGIHHPHVVPILEVGQSDLGYYLVMQFVEGETLSGLTSRAYARGVMLPRLVAVRIVLDTLLGLHAAHQLKDGEGRLQGLVHRDCTPQNILVGVDGSSRITDFGVARAAARLAITRPLTVKGKVAYLSPEQASAGELDRRSDIFTMGIVLWEVLAGRSLFTGDNDGAIVARLLTAPIPSVRNFVKDIPPELDEVCGRALQRLPSRRYATAAAMAEALERAALASLGALGSHTDVGRCVEMLMGAELTTQREALNAWLSQNESAPLSRRRAATDLSSLVPGPPLVPNIPLPARSPTPEAAQPDTSAEAAPKGAPEKNTVESPSMLSLPPRDPAAATTPSEPPPPLASKPPPPLATPAPAAPAGPSWVRRRISAIVVGLAVLVVAGSAPLWFPKANRLRHRLMGHPLPPTGTARPRPSGMPRPRPPASALAASAQAPSAAPPPPAPPPAPE